MTALSRSSERPATKLSLVSLARMCRALSEPITRFALAMLMTFWPRLLIYITLVGGVVGSMAAGARWLVEPDRTLRREARVAPISPRIAESIERKKREPASSPTPQLDAAQPAMREAPVSLSQPSFARIREVNPIRMKASPKKKGPDKSLVVAAPPPVQPVSTARTDFPY